MHFPAVEAWAAQEVVLQRIEPRPDIRGQSVSQIYRVLKLKCQYYQYEMDNRLWMVERFKDSPPVSSTW